MLGTAQFERVTEILDGIADKMARLDTDSEVQEAARYWRKQFAAAKAQPHAANFARRRKAEQKREDGK